VESAKDSPTDSTNPNRVALAIVSATLALVTLLAGLAYVAFRSMGSSKKPVNLQFRPSLTPSTPPTSAQLEPQTYAVAPTPLNDSGASGIFFLREKDVWLTNLDGSEQKQITHSGAIERYFWIPKVQLLVYEDELPSKNENTFAEAIHTLDLTTQQTDIIHKSTIKQACNGQVCEDFSFSLDVSPDGKIIFGQDFLGDPVESKREGVPEKGISRVIYDTDTKRYEATIELPGNTPMPFLPDGSAAGWADDGNIYTYSFATKARTQWTHYPSRLEDYKQHYGPTNLPTAFDFIGWSPDDSRVFFACGTATTGHNIVNVCEASLGSRDIEKLSADMDVVNPTTSSAMASDRSYFYFVLEGPIAEKINTLTGEDVQVVFNSIGAPVPSPSGKVLLFLSDPDRFSLWLMNADTSNRRRIVTDAQNFQWRF
jgi:hypothetical protein